MRPGFSRPYPTDFLELHPRACECPASVFSIGSYALEELVSDIQQILWMDTDFVENEDGTEEAEVEYWDAEKMRDSFAQLDAIIELMERAGLKPKPRPEGK